MSIANAIQKLAGTHGVDVVYLAEVEVTSVNESDRTCEGKSITGFAGAEFTGIRLMANVNDGLLVLPKVGSIIIVMYSKCILPLIVQFSEVEKVLIITGNTTIEIKDGSVKYNDGSFNGFVKIDDLTSKLNEKINLINVELGKIQAGIAAAGGSYALANITTFNKNDYENEKITHGS